MYVAVYPRSYFDFLHIYNALVIGREIALPVWLVDVLISLAVIFLVIDIEFLVRFNLYHFSSKIV